MATSFKLWLHNEIEEDSSLSYLLGKGLGGGTLHFGLQYIDNIIDKSDDLYKNWSKDGYFDSISTIINPFQYTYDSTMTNSFGHIFEDSYMELKDTIEKDSQVIWYNNKIYSQEPISQTYGSRILVGDKIYDKDNITILNNVEITSLHKISSINEHETIDYCVDTQGNKYYASKFAVCAGAIQTPILLKSDFTGANYDSLAIGDTLYDHAGVVCIYRKIDFTSIPGINDNYTPNELPSNFITFSLNSTDDTFIGSTKYNLENKKMHAIFRHSKLSSVQIQEAINGEIQTNLDSITLV